MTPPRDAPVRADVAVVGDGPAGSALAAALRRRGIDVALVGPDAAWSATYSAWIDEIDDSDLVDGSDVFASRTTHVGVRALTLRRLDREYGVLDNDRLRRALRRGVRHVERTITSLDQIDATLVIDATGWPSKLVPGDDVDVGWQVAYGAVLPEPPPGPLGQPMFMDFSDPYGCDGSTDDLGVTTFAYAFAVGTGWLVEETVLVGPDIAPVDLRPRLAARLGMTVEALDEIAVGEEEVRIPMGAPMSEPQHPVPYGATAGFVHPATGYSVATSIASAPGVAAAIDVALAGPAHLAAARVHAAIWPTPLRRTRRLHEYGLDVLTQLDDAETRVFFETFFSLAAVDQAAYLSVRTDPSRLARVMTRMFVRAPWSLRRRLAGGDLRRLLRALRP